MNNVNAELYRRSQNFNLEDARSDGASHQIEEVYGTTAAYDLIENMKTVARMLDYTSPEEDVRIILDFDGNKQEECWLCDGWDIINKPITYPNLSFRNLFEPCNHTQSS